MLRERDALTERFGRIKARGRMAAAGQIALSAMLVGCIVFCGPVMGQTLQSADQSSGAAKGMLIGSNYRISDSSLLGGNHALSPAVAYNNLDNEYLVVWTQREFVGMTNEILGQRLDGAGQTIGEPFQISHTSLVGDELGAGSPDIAYTTAGNEYLVAYQSDRLGRDRFEIFGQRLSSTGEEIGDDFRISTTMDRSFDPTITYNTREDEYLVVWYANVTPFVVDLDVFGQRIDADLNSFGEIGGDFQISQMSDPPNNLTAVDPEVTYNSLSNEYLVVWHSDGGGLSHLMTEIFGQRLTSAGIEIGENDFRISRMSDAGADRDGFHGSVAFDPNHNRYLVVWTGDGGNRGDEEFEIFGTYVEGDGALSAAEFQISEAWVIGATALFPELAFAVENDRYVVCWNAVFAAGSSQIRAREVAPEGVATNTTFAVSSVGAGLRPTAVHNHVDNEVLLLWDDYDILAQRYTTSTSVGIQLTDDYAGAADGLGQNFPNPFRDATRIPFVLRRPGRATVLIYDLTGRAVATLLSEMLPAGRHSLAWNPYDLPSGVYAYRLASPTSHDSRLMVLAR